CANLLFKPSDSQSRRPPPGANASCHCPSCPPEWEPSCPWMMRPSKPAPPKRRPRHQHRLQRPPRVRPPNHGRTRRPLLQPQGNPVWLWSTTNPPRKLACPPPNASCSSWIPTCCCTIRIPCSSSKSTTSFCP